MGTWSKKAREEFLSNKLKGEPSSWDGAINRELMWDNIEKIVKGEISLSDIKEDYLFWLALAVTEMIGAVNWEEVEETSEYVNGKVVRREVRWEPRLLLESRGE